MQVNKTLTSINQNNKNVSFKSGAEFIKAGKNSLSKLVEPERAGNMSRALFLLNAYIFLLGVRYFKSRDNNEKRETLTRDIPTIFAAVFGVPIVEKYIAKKIQKKTGFAITNTAKDSDEGILRFIKNKMGIKAKDKTSIVSDEQLHDWYVLDKHLDENPNSGIKGFIKRLADPKGVNSKNDINLKKICSSLSEEIQGKLAAFSDDNAKFMDELFQKADILDVVKKGFKSGKNKALEQAGYLKAIPKVVGFVITLCSIGFFIPQFNIVYTHKINKNKKAGEKPEKQAEPAKSEKPLQTEKKPIKQEIIKTAENSSTENIKKTYEQFLGDKK